MIILSSNDDYGNHIKDLLPRQLLLDRDELARAVSSAKKSRFDLGDLVTYGYSHEQPKNQDGRVLRDADLRRPK